MPTTRPHSAPSSRSRTRSGSAARSEILTMLKDDHKKAKKAFRDFEKLDPHEDTERCQELVTQTCTDLEIHAQLEDDLFYPAARECLNEEALIDEAQVEHTTFKMLIGELKNMTPDDEKFAATFTVLGEYVKHHIGEEENEIFPQISHAKYNWEELLEEMTQSREELTNELQSSQPSQLSSSAKSGAAAKRSRGSGKGDEAASPEAAADEDEEEQ